MDKLISDLRKAYVNVLAKHKMLYHFDDNARDICWGDTRPSYDEMDLLNALTEILYDDELFQLALKKINKNL